MFSVLPSGKRGILGGTRFVGDNTMFRWVTGPLGLEDGGLGRPFYNGTSYSLSGNCISGAYCNWNTIQPDNSGGGEGVVETRFAINGKWNDIPEPFAANDGCFCQYDGTNTWSPSTAYSISVASRTPSLTDAPSRSITSNNTTTPSIGQPSGTAGRGFEVWYIPLYGQVFLQCIDLCVQSRTGGYLATPRNAEENENLRRAIPVTNAEVFIGGSRNVGDRLQYRWVTGPLGREDNGLGAVLYDSYLDNGSCVSPYYCNFNVGEPSNYSLGPQALTGEYWVVLFQSSGVWNDDYIGDGCLCQRPLSTMVPTVSLYFSSSESTTIAASASRTRSLSASAETTKSLTPPPTPTPTWIVTPSLTLSLVSHNVTASPTITVSPTTTAIPTLSTTPTSSESTPSSTESFLTHTASTTFSVSSTNLSTVSSSRTYPNCSVPLAVLFTDAVAILDDTITSITQNSTTSTITIDDLCGVLWPSSDSPSMQLLHCVYPAIVASGSDNLTWSVAVSSLPVTPVRMVFGFTLSPSWSMQPFNDTSTSNIDLSNVTMRVVQSAYQGTLGFVSTVVSVPPTYGSVLVVPLVARCATVHIKFSIIVQWPAAPAVTTATVVTTTLASTVGAALGGDVVSAASLVLLSMLSCNTLAPNPGVSGYVMSVFFDDGPVSMVTGNVGIGAFVSLCQFGLVSVVARLRSQSHDDVAATLRFPAVSIRATDFLLPGTMYSALTFWSTEIGAVATGVFGAMVVVVALVALEYFYAVLYVLPLCDYAKYNTSHYPTGHWLEARFLFPTWQWYPRGVRSRFWPMMGPYVPGKTWVRGVIMCLALLLALVAGMASSGVGCVSGAWTAGIIHIAVAVVLVALKPFRVPSDALLGPLGTTIIGMACCLKATGNDDAVAVSDDITTAMALLQVVRTLIGLWVQWREGQWISEERSLESQHDVEEGRDGSDKIAEWDDGEDVPMSLLQSNDDGTEMVTLHRVEVVGLAKNNNNNKNDISGPMMAANLGLLALDHTEPVNDDESLWEIHPLAFSGIEGYFIKAAKPIALI